MDVSINGARILATFEGVPLLGKVQITQTLVVSWLVFLIISGLCIRSSEDRFGSTLVNLSSFRTFHDPPSSDGLCLRTSLLLLLSKVYSIGLSELDAIM